MKTEVTSMVIPINWLIRRVYSKSGCDWSKTEVDFPLRHLMADATEVRTFLKKAEIFDMLNSDG